MPYAQIALIFSMFILFETWPVPVAGYFVDRFGIRKLMILGSIGILVGWFLGGTVAKSVSDLYIYYGVIAGTGAGIIYISTVANAVKWFPDRRGLAAGLTAAGFGGGAAITIMPIAATISSMGWAGAMAAWGVAQVIAARVIALAGSKSNLQFIPSVQWRGPAFLNEVWDLSWKKAEKELQYEPTEVSTALESQFMNALRDCLNLVKQKKA